MRGLWACPQHSIQIDKVLLGQQGMIRLNKHKDDSFPFVFIHAVAGSVRWRATIVVRERAATQPCGRQAENEFTRLPSGGSKVQVNERNAMCARTWREAKRKLSTRQSKIPSGPKSATNKFGSAVAVVTN